MEGIFGAWGKVLRGYNPLLSIELTRECPLRCPGCYAYGEDHLGGGVTLRQVRDLKGQELIDGVLGLIKEHKPLHVSIIGGEPLVRYRELNELLPRMAALGIHTQLVTSAVRPIPLEWKTIPHFSLVVSIDGLQPEHDERRAPATYQRILQHIVDHQITVHCTVTRQQATREGYLKEFCRFWSDQPATRRIWMSLYTPQIGEESEEKLTPEDRRNVIAELLVLKEDFPKLQMTRGTIRAYDEPPASPEECLFAKTTTCVSADLKRPITPCQFGGKPDCKNCGCMASAGFISFARIKLGGHVPIAPFMNASLQIGSMSKRIREHFRTPPAEDIY
jgi:MoaA/NifB/PqqE/SkfB family radical SAM enzyme